MGQNPLLKLSALGQSVWYDFVTRDLLTSGTLAALIADDGLRGMTSNPTIFQMAIAGSTDYDADIRAHASKGHTAQETFEALAVADVQAACDAFAALYTSSGGTDGLVSLEVSPELAYDTDATIQEATRLWHAVDRRNLQIKIPGTAAGLPAVEQCIAQGINVNVTLLFNVDRYREVVDAFVTGLETRIRQDLPIDGIVSVASFFVSRLDSKIDPMLDSLSAPAALRSKAAIANAATAYGEFEHFIHSHRWERLAQKGAKVQRPLWASTSAKDPALSDVYYVEALIAPETVNTLPPATFDAYRDHGEPAVRIHETLARAPSQLAALADVGIDLGAVTADLEREGVEKFAESYRSLLAEIDSKARALAGA
jgi:transaldolase/transaldolase/glucose-6-phosphate isomerase